RASAALPWPAAGSGRARSCPGPASARVAPCRSSSAAAGRRDLAEHDPIAVARGGALRRLVAGRGRLALGGGRVLGGRRVLGGAAGLGGAGFGGGCCAAAEPAKVSSNAAARPRAMVFSATRMCG